MENVAINARKKFTMEKYFSQVKIVTPNNISKLFGFYARSVISSIEMVNNYFVVSGKIIANAVYLNDENEIENTETTVDFVEKQKANCMTKWSFTNLFSTAFSVSGKNLKIMPMKKR